jgi:hypothetical protein
MVGRVLTGNGISRYGEGTGAHQGAGPLRVLRGEAVAQQTPHQRALDVDPIIPRNSVSPAPGRHWPPSHQ